MFFIGNAMFIVWGSGEIQYWNEPVMEKNSKITVQEAAAATEINIELTTNVKQ